MYNTAKTHHDVIYWPCATLVHVYTYKHHLKQPFCLCQPPMNKTCLKFLRLLAFSFSLTAHTLPTLDSVISKMVAHD